MQSTGGAGLADDSLQVRLRKADRVALSTLLQDSKVVHLGLSEAKLAITRHLGSLPAPQSSPCALGADSISRSISFTSFEVMPPVNILFWSLAGEAGRREVRTVDAAFLAGGKVTLVIV